jgi:hypothetical protein
MNFDALPPNPRKTLSTRPLGRVDIAALREAVLTLPEAVWAAEDAGKTNRFETLGSTQHIVFRMVADFLDWRASTDGPLWPEWHPLIEPVLAQATADYGYERGAFPRIMLARMAPGGVIHPHRDTNLSAKWPHKIHVPIQTSDQVTFYLNRVPHHFVEGEAVEVNNMGPHSVVNGGTTDRIHLIFEYYDLDQPEPAWMDDLRAQMAAQPR